MTVLEGAPSYLMTDGANEAVAETFDAFHVTPVEGGHHIAPFQTAGTKHNRVGGNLGDYQTVPSLITNTLLDG